MGKSACVSEYLQKYFNKEHHLMVAQSILQEYCKGGFEYICIFGAGVRGKKMYYELYDKLVPVECFADNNSTKWGNVVESVYCVPPDLLKMNKNDMLVIISLEHGVEGVYAQLRKLGVVNILTEEDVLRLLSKIPKALPLGCIEVIDYNTPQINYLVEKFNSLIHDICNHYEKQIEDVKKEFVRSRN